MTQVLILIMAFAAGAVLWMTVGELVLLPLMSRALRLFGLEDDQGQNR
jgi:hypothetical protein